MNDPGTARTFHASFAGQIGIARADITPSPGVYARNWGAAAHDTADSIHRPLTASVVTFAARGREHGPQSGPLVLVAADLGWWRGLPVFRGFLAHLLDALSLDASSLMFALAHTHAAVTLAEPTPEMPGQEILRDYWDRLLHSVIDAVRRALAGAAEGILDWHVGRCSLACVRDLPDPDPTRNRLLCGYNPDQTADDTLLVGRVTDRRGRIRATLVNYACHPTTLAWENRAISPDFVGAMRETVEAATGAPAVFLQGASGDLAPRFQYVGDPRVADRHGRQLGYAALATLEDMEPPGTRLVFDRTVESGAPLAVWRHEALEPPDRADCLHTVVDVPLKAWPNSQELEQQRLACTDRALEERLRRKRDIRRALGDGDHYPLPILAWRIGDSVVVGSMAEAYSHLQRSLRGRFPNLAIACLNLVNGSIGYLPPAEMYELDVYQVWQTPFARGSLELVIEAMATAIQAITSAGS